jgi:chemotaxis response regulator CheB
MTEKRLGGDRRRQPRGGRRPEDVRGFTPLVMVVDSEVRRRDISEAILAKLMFAVAPVESADKAVSILKALNPEVIVAGEQDARRIRELMPVEEDIPILAVGDDTRVTESLIEEVRRSLRDRVPS